MISLGEFFNAMLFGGSNTWSNLPKEEQGKLNKAIEQTIAEYERRKALPTAAQLAYEAFISDPGNHPSPYAGLNEETKQAWMHAATAARRSDLP